MLHSCLTFGRGVDTKEVHVPRLRGAERSFIRHMCTMQSSRTSAVGQLCFHDQTEKGVCLLIPRRGAREKKKFERHHLCGLSKMWASWRLHTSKRSTTAILSSIHPLSILCPVGRRQCFSGKLSSTSRVTLDCYCRSIIRG